MPTLRTVSNKSTRYHNVHKFDEKIDSKKVYPSTSIVIAASSDDVLTIILQNIKDSVWWNHQAFLLIVNRNSTNSCQMAESFLNTVWSFNILSTVYLCHNSTHQSNLYAFNPYAPLAPKFWSKVLAGSSVHKRWTLFERQVSAENPFDSGRY